MLQRIEVVSAQGALLNLPVRGQPLFVYYSYTPDTVHTLAWLTRVRWQGLGERIH